MMPVSCVSIRRYVSVIPRLTVFTIIFLLQVLEWRGQKDFIQLLHKGKKRFSIGVITGAVSS